MDIIIAGNGSGDDDFIARLCVVDAVKGNDRFFFIGSCGKGDGKRKYEHCGQNNT